MATHCQVCRVILKGSVTFVLVPHYGYVSVEICLAKAPGTKKNKQTFFNAAVLLFPLLWHVDLGVKLHRVGVVWVTLTCTTLFQFGYTPVDNSFSVDLHNVQSTPCGCVWDYLSKKVLVHRAVIFKCHLQVQYLQTLWVGRSGNGSWGGHGPM